MNVENGKIGLTLRLGAIVAALLLGQQAMAEGTRAGVEIRNTANVDYEVGGVPQDDIDSNEVVFVVDRRVDFTLLPVATPGQEPVSPGETAAWVDFELTNTSNSELDFSFAAVNASAGADVDGAPDSGADMTNVAYDVYPAGSPPAAPGDGASFADQLAADDSIFIRVWGDAALALADGAIAGVQLTATARAPGSGGTGVLLYGQAATDAGIENVAGDAGNDGVEISIDGFIVEGADISIVKMYEVIDDGFPGAIEYPVPGAIVEYTITVENASTSAPATAVVITDTLDDDLAFLPNQYGGVNDMTVDGVGCTEEAAGADGCLRVDQDLTFDGITIAAAPAVGTPTVLVVKFRATILDPATTPAP